MGSSQNITHVLHVVLLFRRHFAFHIVLVSQRPSATITGRGQQPPQRTYKMERTSSGLSAARNHHIERLSQDVINRIAAGEVVQRPSAALKEILENSIDAGSTRIQVLCEDGGLGVLQIIDDGCGIFKDDLPLLCERFATSKLRSFNDLSHVSSFGFRGEALASIAHVARVTVTTMQRGEPHAWIAKYAEGKMISGPTVHPGNPGTSLRVEDMFYNAPVRKSSLGKAAEEYARVLSVVQRYSMCFPHIAFSCRNVNDAKWNGATGSAKADYATQAGSSMLLNVKATFGTSLASHLIRLEKSITISSSEGRGHSDGATTTSATVSGGEITGFISDPTLSNKRASLILFVNDRLVDSASIRRCLEQVYASVVTGGQKYFAILTIHLPPQRVDVNIHPTKHEVMMMDEEIVLRALVETVRHELAKSASAKQLHVGEVDHRVLNLKPVSSSSTNVGTAGHRGVVVAPCTMTRVTDQRGDMMKYAVKVDRFDLLAKDERLLREGEEKATHPSPVPSQAREEVERSLRPESSRDALLVEVLPQVQEDGATAAMVPAQTLVDAEEENATCPPSVDHLAVATVIPAIHADVVEGSEVSDQRAHHAPPIMVVPSLLDNDEEDEAEDIQREFKKRRIDRDVPACCNHKEAPVPDMQTSTQRATTVPPAVFKDHPVEVVALADAGKKTRASSDALPPAATETSPEVALSSVLAMQELYTSQSPDDMRQLFQKMVIVGVVDPALFFAQSGTSLFAIQTARLAKQVALQKLFFSFGRHAQVTFVDGTAPSVRALLRYAVEHCITPEKRQMLITSQLSGEHSNRIPNDADAVEKAIDQALKTIRKWRHMLEEYFCIELTKAPRSHGPSSSHDLLLTKLPLILGDAWPIAHCRVPLLMWRLAHDVKYSTSDEEQCLAEVAGVIATELFERGGIEVLDAEAERLRVSSGRGSTAYNAIRFGLLPAATSGRHYFPGMDLFTSHVLRSVVTVEALYKVFERC